MKKMITTLLLAGALLLPSTAVLAKTDTNAVNSYQMQEQQFKAFYEKLQAARAELGPVEFAKFARHLIPFAAFMASVDPNHLTPEQQATQQRLLEPLLPYFEQLNAGHFPYANAIYGSFANLKKAVPNSTIDDYKRFNDKMAAAFDVLGAEEFAKFQALVKEMTAIALPYYDANGQLDTSKMTPEDHAKFQEVSAKLQPYFERLG